MTFESYMNSSSTFLQERDLTDEKLKSAIFINGNEKKRWGQ